MSQTDKDDLISREALKKDFEKVYPLALNELGGVVNKQIYEIIDNAPTVEPEKAKESELIKAYTKGFDTGVETVKNERPQGDLISREALKKAIAEFHQKQKERLHNPLLESIGFNALNMLIDNAPTVDRRGNRKETTFDDYLKDQLKDPEFRKEWEKLCDDDMQDGGAEMRGEE